VATSLGTTMAISFACPHCAARLRSKRPGSRVVCPACREPIYVPTYVAKRPETSSASPAPLVDPETIDSAANAATPPPQHGLRRGRLIAACVSLAFVAIGGMALYKNHTRLGTAVDMKDRGPMNPVPQQQAAKPAALPESLKREDIARFWATAPPEHFLAFF